jgi:hypothetical protein
MSEQKKSELGDLTDLAKRIEKTLKEHFEVTKGRPVMAIMFTLPNAPTKAHWVTNVTREQGIDMVTQLAKQMAAGLC